MTGVNQDTDKPLVIPEEARVKIVTAIDRNPVKIFDTLFPDEEFKK